MLMYLNINIHLNMKTAYKKINIKIRKSLNVVKSKLLYI